MSQLQIGVGGTKIPNLDVKRPKGTTTIKGKGPRAPEPNTETKTETADENRASLMYMNTGNVWEDRGQKRTRRKSACRNTSTASTTKDSAEIKPEPVNKEVQA